MAQSRFGISRTGRETFSFHDERLANPWNAWFSPDARRLAWSCLDGFIRIWDTTTGRLEINQPSNTHQCRAVAFSPDGTRIAVAGFDGTIRLLDGASGREMLTIFAHNSLVAGVTFSPDGHRLASSSYDHTVRIWDAAPLTSDPLAPHCVTLTGHKEKVSGVAFSPNGRWLASASWDHTIKLWELSNNGESQPSPPAAQSPAAGLGAISLRYTLRGHRGIVTGVDFSSDNRTLASASLDNTFKLWDLQAPSGDSLTERLSIPVTQRAMSIAFSPDGKLLALGQDNGIALYDPATGKAVRPFKATPAPVPSLAFHPDRPLLISAGASDPAVKVWDVAAEKPSFEIRHECQFECQRRHQPRRPTHCIAGARPGGGRSYRESLEHGLGREDVHRIPHAEGPPRLCLEGGLQPGRPLPGLRKLGLDRKGLGLDGARIGGAGHAPRSRRLYPESGVQPRRPAPGLGQRLCGAWRDHGLGCGAVGQLRAVNRAIAFNTPPK